VLDERASSVFVLDKAISSRSCLIAHMPPRLNVLAMIYPRRHSIAVLDGLFSLSVKALQPRINRLSGPLKHNGYLAGVFPGLQEFVQFLFSSAVHGRGAALEGVILLSPSDLLDQASCLNHFFGLAPKMPKMIANAFRRSLELGGNKHP
jgi:hypothetical protein